MLAKTLKALLGSITKWEKIRDNKLQDYGSSNCPLCKLCGHGTKEGINCAPCPVYQKTGKHMCSGTPYDTFGDLNQENHTKRVRQVAQSEVNFLCRLLPKDHEACSKITPSKDIK